MTTEPNEQHEMNDKIIRALDDIQAQNSEIVAKIDNLEHTVTKKATTAGAISGAIAGGIISVGVEFIKLKLGG